MRFMPLTTRRLALLGAATAPWLAALAASQGPATSFTPTDEDAKIIAAGLEAWRKPGGKLNSACSSCHSPDGFDLAIFDFGDMHIRRRALGHVRMDDADKIVDMIHAVRRQYKITEPLDPHAVRPFQPGGEVLPGETAEARDLAFGNSLRPLLPTLLGERIDSLEKAKRARDEALAVDVWNLRIGIPFNRWSEDKHRGDGRGIVADWIPDVPRSPKPEREQEWFALQDAYIASPTEENLRRLIDSLDECTAPFSTLSFSALGTHKYRSLLLAQHALRERAMPARAAGPFETTLFKRRGGGEVANPIWDVGEYATRHMLFDHESQGMPEILITDLSPEVPMPKQLQQIRPAWFWLGWLMDPGMQRTAGDINTHNGRYFTLSLWEDGPYAMHSAFMIFRKQMVQSFDPSALPEGQEQRFVLDYSEFGRVARAKRFWPADRELSDLVARFACNAMRASLYLFIEDVQKNGKPENPVAAKYHVGAARDFLATYSPDTINEDEELQARAAAVLKS